jgi:putative nucleotidyltransferase with HDIG domain
MKDEQSVREKVVCLFEYLTRTEHGDYLGEPITQLEHTLQAAMLAQQSGADEETILGALLHDIGHFIPTKQAVTDNAPDMISPSGEFIGKGSHDKFGEAYLRDFGFSEKVCQLVGGHVIAKRYLTAVDQSYYDTLSDASKKTLHYQGGPMSKEEQSKAEQDPWLKNKLQVRIWDDLAKDPSTSAPPIENYIDMAVRNVLTQSN